MSLIVLPYLGPDAARREQRGIETFSSGRKRPAGLKSPTRLAELAGDDPLREVPMRLTYRTARVLQAAAANPGASNRRIGERSDVYDQGQISKLLGRLQRLGAGTERRRGGHAKGEANAWFLTRLRGAGRAAAQSRRLDTGYATGGEPCSLAVTVDEQGGVRDHLAEESANARWACRYGERACAAIRV